jgi:hypothetical protein
LRHLTRQLATVVTSTRKLKALNILSPILSLPGLVEKVVKTGNHTTRNCCDLNSQNEGPELLSPILPPTGLVLKIVKTGNHTTRNCCDLNSQNEGPELLPPIPPPSRPRETQTSPIEPKSHTGIG